MIDGVTVLNKIAIIGIPAWAATIFVVLFFAFGGGSFLVANIRIEKDKSLTPALLCVAAAICVFVVGMVLDSNLSTGRYKYECTIDDSVSINELYDHYDVVEQRGDIWVLKDKEG